MTTKRIPQSWVRVVGTEMYKFAHGHNPSGNGQWAFEIDGKILWCCGKYSDAKKDAIKVAAKNGIYEVKVLS